MREAGDEDAMRHLYSVFHLCGSDCHSGQSTRTESFHLLARRLIDTGDQINDVRMENDSNKEKEMKK